MKRVFIIHGWGGRPDCGWLAWLNKELSSRGFKVFAPDMPNKEFPKIEKWVPYLSKIVGNADEDTYFIGHSIGCQTILRYLESQDNKAGGVIFVGGWLKVKGLESEEEEEVSGPWVKSPIHLEKVRKKVNKFISVASDDDPFVSLENSKIFKEKLGAKIIIEKGKGHYIENVTKTIPIVLKEILELSK